MSKPLRRLDRNRPYGQIAPVHADGAAFVQDDLHFDVAGNCLDPDAPPEPKRESQPAHSAPPPKGGVVVSGALTPRPMVEWQTMHFPTLRKLIFEAKGHNAPNRVAAMKWLEANNYFA